MKNVHKERKLDNLGQDLVIKSSANQEQIISKIVANQEQIISKSTSQKRLGSWSISGFTLMTWTIFVSSLELNM